VAAIWKGMLVTGKGANGRAAGNSEKICVCGESKHEEWNINYESWTILACILLLYPSLLDTHCSSLLSPL